MVVRWLAWSVVTEMSRVQIPADTCDNNRLDGLRLSMSNGPEVLLNGYFVRQGKNFKADILVRNHFKHGIIAAGFNRKRQGKYYNYNVAKELCIKTAKISKFALIYLSLLS